MADKDPRVRTPGGLRAASEVHHVGLHEAVEETAEGGRIVARAGPQMPPGHVIMPGGPRPKELLHRVEADTVLDLAGGMLRHVHPSGRVLAEYAEKIADARLSARPLLPLDFTSVTPTDHPDNWITYASWTNGTGTPVSYFATTWTVPPEPPTHADQTVFLFNGIQNSTRIYQPVLQWGVSGAGGGDHWAVASWYADGQTGHQYYSDLVEVSPGDVLVGVMKLTAQSGGKFSYDCYFKGIPHTSLKITNVPQLTWLVQVLECYGITQCSDYFGGGVVAMREIDVRTGSSRPALSWSVTNKATECGQHTRVVSNSATDGQVHLFAKRLPEAAELWRSAWTAGWTAFSIVPFPGDQAVYVGYKRGDGSATIDRVRPDFTGVDTEWTATLPTGFTSVFAFHLDDGPYVLAHDRQSHAVRIYKVHADATGLDEVFHTTWGKGYLLTPFALGGKAHYVAYDPVGGGVSIDRINPGGHDVTTVWGSTWSLGWTRFAPFVLDGKPHYFAYKHGAGTVNVDRVKDDGHGVDTIWSGTLAKGFTAVNPFRVGSRQYFQLYDAATGATEIRQLGGTAAQRTLHRPWHGTWTTGWTMFLPFQLGGDDHHLVYKSAEGTVAIDRYTD